MTVLDIIRNPRKAKETLADIEAAFDDCASAIDSDDPMAGYRRGIRDGYEIRFDAHDSCALYGPDGTDQRIDLETFDEDEMEEVFWHIYNPVRLVSPILILFVLLLAGCSDGSIFGANTPNCWECRTVVRSSNGGGNSDQTNTFCGTRAEMREIEETGTMTVSANGVTVSSQTKCKK